VKTIHTHPGKPHLDDMASCALLHMLDETCQVVNIRWIILVLFSFVILAAADGQDAARAPVPPEERCLQIRTELTDLFAERWNAALAGGQPAGDMARELVDAADKASDLAEIYAMRRESISFALLGGDLGLATQQVSAINGGFQIGTETVLKDALGKANGGKGIKAPEVDALIATMASWDDQTMGTLGVTAVRTLLDGLSIAARKCGNPPSVTTLTKARQDIERRLKDVERMSDARLALKDKPDDPAANLIVGRFLLLNEGPTAEAMDCLAKVADQRLATAAIAHAAFDGSRPSQKGLFEKWGAVTTNADKAIAAVAARLAIDAGSVLAADATGLEKLKIDRRLNDLRTLMDNSGLTPKTSEFEFPVCAWTGHQNKNNVVDIPKAVVGKRLCGWTLSFWCLGNGGGDTNGSVSIIGSTGKEMIIGGWSSAEKIPGGANIPTEPLPDNARIISFVIKENITILDGDKIKFQYQRGANALVIYKAKLTLSKSK
jgi:hypothetical protein